VDSRPLSGRFLEDVYGLTVATFAGGFGFATVPVTFTGCWPLYKSIKTAGGRQAVSYALEASISSRRARNPVQRLPAAWFARLEDG